MIKASLYFVGLLIVGLIAFGAVAIMVIAAILVAVGSEAIAPSPSPSLASKPEPDPDLVSALINLGYRKAYARKLVGDGLASGKIRPGEPIETALKRLLREKA